MFIGNSCPHRGDWRSSSTERLGNGAAALVARRLISEAVLDIVSVEPIYKASFLGRASEFLMRSFGYVVVEEQIALVDRRTRKVELVFPRWGK
jgi:hypothetical protein